ncbi:hypothetical protein C8J56DRAFT_925608 [Mycena floridula]|nr:hypothetical protein C8J56DRAFT_925608 [Mycena floridula]
MFKSLVTELCVDCSSKFISRDFGIQASLEKLRSGHFIADSEKESILFQLPIADDELSRYEAQLFRLRSITEKLELERNNLFQSILHARALTSPIRRLPAEILTIIFEWCLEPSPEDYHESDFVFLNDFTEPENLQISVLTSVCSVWRDVALATRGFWSKIAVNAGSCTEATERLIDLHAERSKGLPLTLRIHNTHPSYEDEHCGCCDPEVYGRYPPVDPIHEACNNVMQSLMNRASRFSSLIVHVYKSAFSFRGAREGWTVSFPELKRLEMRLDKHIILEEEEGFPEYDMPKLQHLVLEHVPIDSYIFSIKLPFQQITSLEVANTFLENIIRVLQYCPQLQHLRAKFQHIWDGNLKTDNNEICPFPTIYITHKLLQTVHITVFAQHDPYACPLLFSTLTLPSLHSLSLTGIIWPCPAFNSFISRSDSAIQKLSLNQIDLAEWLLPETLNLLPRLSHLVWSDIECFGDMKDQSAYNDFLELIPNELPRLTHIDLSLSLHSYAELVELVRLRSKASLDRPLQQITLSIHPADRYNAVVAELEGFRREGLNLDIRRHTDW